MEGELKNIGEACLATIGSLCYSYYISSKIPKGKLRLFSLLPIFSLFIVLPLHLTSAFSTFLTAFFITSLASFKLLLFAFGLGPLSFEKNTIKENKSIVHFIILACLPVRDSATSSSRPPKAKKLNISLSTQSMLFSILVAILSKFGGAMHPKILLAFYCCLSFLLVDLVMLLSNMVARALVGLELEPPSDEPYLSTSLQDFWGKRWNLIVTNTLRHTVYKPMRSMWGPIAGILASFVVSGLLHELVLYYVTRKCPTWDMTRFFVFHAVCVVCEVAAKRTAGARWRVPVVVAAPVTVGFVVATSSCLFFPVVMRSGADAMFAEEFNYFVDFIKAKTKSIIVL